jgi:DnaJ-class molecular chaperone
VRALPALRKWHPDKNPTNKEAAEAKFREVCPATAALP